MLGEIPTGTVTFFFTDVEGSTRLWDRVPEQMNAALALHDGVLEETIEAHGGYVFTTAGDSFAASFSRASSAVACAQAAQERLTSVDWPAEATLRVRMGLHTGEAHERRGDYFGPHVNRAARIMSAAHGSQILLSSTTTSHVAGSVRVEPVAELDLKGLSAAETVYQLLSPSLPAHFPPIRSEAARSNVPHQRHELFGRGAEIRTVVESLTRTRLVSIVGAGGMGKTALASAAARAVESRFTGGVWFVDLTSVGADADVSAAIANAVGVQNAGESSGVVAAKVGQRDVLVVLDNCEHVIDGAAEFTNLLLDQEFGSVLATSREALSVPAERVVRLSPLAIDVDGPAVELFFERSAAVGAAVEPGDPVAAAMVVEICRRLDGSPLAIELAAARAGLLPLEEIARRLDERFSLLRRRRHTDERHRSLDACLTWSVDLLDGGDRGVLEHVSVFPGPFDVELAQSVCVSRNAEVVDSIDVLLEASLLEPTGDGRVRLLESTRAFGRERLIERGQLEETARRHADAVLERVRAIVEGGRTRSALGVASLPQIERLIPDIRQAVRGALAAGDVGIAARMVLELRQFADAGLWLECGQWAADIVHDPKAAQLEERPILLVTAGYLSLYRLDPKGVDLRRRQLVDALEEWEPQDPIERWAVDGYLAVATAFVEGDARAAAKMLQSIAEDAVSQNELLFGSLYFGLAAFQMTVIGDAEWSEPRARRSLELAIKADAAADTRAQAHFQLALALDVQGSERAEEQLEACWRLARHEVTNVVLVAAWALLALRRVTRGEVAGVAVLVIEAVDRLYQEGVELYLWPCLGVVAQLLAELELFDDALRLAGAVQASPYVARLGAPDWANNAVERSASVVGVETADRLRAEGAAMPLKELRDLAVRAVVAIDPEAHP